MRAAFARSRIMLTTAALAAFSFTGAAQAVTLVDGSFEAGNFDARIVRNGAARQVIPVAGTPSDGVMAGILAPAGWLQYGSGVGFVDNSIWAASAGQRSLDLGARGDGGIVQRISGFTVGRLYRLTFDVSANPFDPAEQPRDKRVQVGASGATPQSFTYALTGANTPENMLYQTHFFDFRAIGETQNIRFSSLSPGSFGAVIDNVTLSVVPEATTWALLISGFSAVGIMSRRRRAQRPSVAA